MANSSKKLILLHVTETLRGGPASYLNMIIREQVVSQQFAAISLVAPAQDLGDLTIRDIIPVVTYTRTGRNLGSLLRLSYVLARKVLEERPDVVHLHSTFAGAVGRLVLLLLGYHTRTVYCSHGWAFLRKQSQIKTEVFSLFELAFSKITGSIICISNREYKAALDIGMPERKLALVHNGISTDHPCSKSIHWHDHRLKLLFVGRFDRQKGLDIFFEACNLLSEEVCGRAIGASVIDRSVTKVAPPNVEVLGWQDIESVQSHMRCCDIVVIPSRWEGFGLVAVEAMREGKAVVASNVGGLRDIVRDGKTGVLFEPVTANYLCQALMRAKSYDLKEFGASGKRLFLAQFTSKKCSENTLKTYMALLEPVSVPLRIET